MNRVRELRRRAGMMQKELADAVGVNRPTISGWETQRSDPTGARLQKIAELFGVSTGCVLCYADIPNPTPVLFVDDGSLSENERRILEARENVRRDPERGILFQMATDASIQDVRRAIAILKALESSEE